MQSVVKVGDNITNDSSLGFRLVDITLADDWIAMREAFMSMLDE